MPDLPDDVDAKIRFDNRLPESLERMAMDFVRELTSSMSDEEFFALRTYWRSASSFLDKHFNDYPEASSAREFITAMLSATNHRAYAIAPTPDSPHPTVDDLIAENKALKARIAELEAQIPSPYQTEAPKPSTNYTTSVSGMPHARFILRGKVVVDNSRDDWRESEAKARQLALELEAKMREAHYTKLRQAEDYVEELRKRAEAEKEQYDNGNR